jgi:hypothetical protein
VWAITSFFNPVGYKQRVSIYRIFRANRAVPLVRVELAFDGHFELTSADADILVQISGGALLWQKERLLNIALRSVPQNINTIAWIDCDVIFESQDWARDAELQLAKVNIVQLFSDLVDLSPEDRQPKNNGRKLPATGHGIVSAIKSGAITHLGTATATWQSIRAFPTGVAWAARREVLEKHGLYDALIIGGGDSAMIHAIYGQFEQETQLHHLNKARREHYLRWARPYNRTIAEKVDSVPGRIYHLWHGKFIHRRNRERHRLLANFDFDPDADLMVGPNGAWQWARPRPDLEDFLKGYFISRGEDE